ncbi:MAG: DUF4886 domain-containing protein [Lentisphaerae bacterium]|jgi:hypothetical protein|nr:DUF4886 domain-containing protein [Lentisphaerota bacterium]
MKVLSVGNSFSVNAHTYLRKIAKAGKSDLTLFNCYIGGCTLERHMTHVDAFEADEKDPEGSPYPIAGGEMLSLRDALLLDQWEIVTIQQASHESFKPQSFYPHAARLAEYILKYAPKAEIVVHQTWAYRDDHAFWGDKNFNTDIMYKALRKTYHDFCKENNYRMIPSGDAFQNARVSKMWGKPVFSKKRKNGMMKRSLHVDDAFHANSNGCYLLGCIWFEFLFGKDVREIRFKPWSIPRSDASILREIAHKTIKHSNRHL